MSAGQEEKAVGTVWHDVDVGRTCTSVRESWFADNAEGELTDLEESTRNVLYRHSLKAPRTRQRSIEACLVDIAPVAAVG